MAQVVTVGDMALQPEPAEFDSLVTKIRESRLPSPAVRREIRENAGVSVREAAAANGVSPMTYLRWEHGQVQPRRAHAIKFRAFLDALQRAVAGGSVLLTLALWVVILTAMLLGISVPKPEDVPTVSIETAAPWFGLGRSSAYEAARRGEIPTLRFGRAIRVPVAAARALLGIDPPPEPGTTDAEVVQLPQREAR